MHLSIYLVAPPPLPSSLLLHLFTLSHTHLTWSDIRSDPKKKFAKEIPKKRQPKTVIISQQAPFRMHRCVKHFYSMNAKSMCGVCKTVLFMATFAITFLFLSLEKLVFCSSQSLSFSDYKLTYIEQWHSPSCFFYLANFSVEM